MDAKTEVCPCSHIPFESLRNFHGPHCRLYEKFTSIVAEAGSSVEWNCIRVPLVDSQKLFANKVSKIY